MNSAESWNSGTSEATGSRGPRRRRRAEVLAVAVAALALAGCGQAPTPEGEEQQAGGGEDGGLELGLPLPYTGQYSWVGANVEEVTQLLLDEDINAEGGIGGREVTFVRGDTEGTVDAGVLAARKLSGTDNVLAFIGPTSLSFTGVRQVITDTGVPMMSPTAGTAELDTAGKELFFRTVPSDSLGGRAIARAVTDAATYLGRPDPFERVALMVGQAPALVSFQEPIVSAMEEYGLPLTSTTTYTTGKQSYRSELANVLEEDPQMIILVAEPADSAKIMQEAFQAGYEGSWFVTQDQTTAEYVELAGPDLVEDVYGLIEAAPEEAADLRKDFETRLGHELKIFQSNAYDSINVTALAMLAAQEADGEVTRETITAHLDEVANPAEGDVVVTSYPEGAEALAAGKGIDYQGLSGPVDFDEYGNITSPFNIQQVTDGSFVDVALVRAETLR